MKQNIGFSQFCDAFRAYDRDNNFTYVGKRALFDYLEEMEEDTGEEMELDIIALCCEYSEYSTAVACAHEYSYVFDKSQTTEEQEAAALDWLQNKTNVIVFDEFDNKIAHSCVFCGKGEATQGDYCRSCSDNIPM